MILTILSFIFVFLAVTLAHEIGHFIFAKSAGIRVHEFGLGLGPRIFSFKKNHTLYSLNLFPIAGFIRLAGIEDESEEEKACPEEEKYYNKTPWAKFKAISAGPFFNILLAVFIIYFVLLTLGLPVGLSSEIATVVPSSPSAKAGLKPGDRLEAVNGKALKMEAAIELIHKSSGKSLTLSVKRGEKLFKVVVSPKYDPRLKVGLIGFSPRPVYKRINPARALILSLAQTAGMVGLILYLLGQLIIGKISILDLAGPVGIASVTGQFAAQGWLPFLSFTAFLSINLGVANLLPLPALDGGRIFFVLLEAIRGKPLDIKKENFIHYVGLIILIGLMVLITINDILRLLRR